MGCQQTTQVQGVLKFTALLPNSTPELDFDAPNILQGLGGNRERCIVGGIHACSPAPDHRSTLRTNSRLLVNSVFEFSIFQRKRSLMLLHIVLFVS